MQLCEQCKSQPGQIYAAFPARLCRNCAESHASQSAHIGESKVSNILKEFLSAGPSRQSQLEPDVREIYRKFGLCPNSVPPDEAYRLLTTAPSVAYRVICWFVAPEHRNNRTLSDGAQFRTYDEAMRYVNRVRLRGGEIHSIREIHEPTYWYETLAHFDRLGTMTADEIAELREHCNQLHASRSAQIS